MSVKDWRLKGLANREIAVAALALGVLAGCTTSRHSTGDEWNQSAVTARFESLAFAFPTHIPDEPPPPRGYKLVPTGLSLTYTFVNHTARNVFLDSAAARDNPVLDEEVKDAKDSVTELRLRNGALEYQSGVALNEALFIPPHDSAEQSVFVLVTCDPFLDASKCLPKAVGDASDLVLFDFGNHLEVKLPLPPPKLPVQSSVKPVAH